MRNCLANPKVRHDGTDKQDPDFDVYQNIQSQNNYSTTQLNVMGYRGNMLRAQFQADKISKKQALVPVTVPHTCERQDAVAAERTNGKKFFVMGGEHVMSDDMFKAVEINRWSEEATEREKEKKSWVRYHIGCKATLPVVDRL
jgi:hypothetical protein